MDVSVPTTADDTVLAAPPRRLRMWRWLAAGIALLALLGAVVVSSAAPPRRPIAWRRSPEVRLPPR